MDTDLHQIIRSSQALTDDHCHTSSIRSRWSASIREPIHWRSTSSTRCSCLIRKKRLTVTDALEHPYLSMLHDAALEPSASAAFEFLISEDEELREDALREKVWNEMCYYHPEATTMSIAKITKRNRKHQELPRTLTVIRRGVTARMTLLTWNG
ncbi:hypothetical protein JRQ81_000018 [Phrynocephalus forsythii]|uniref:Protein kinase domain-containing protein n=1 Tax=Phrynocephalus forsythii TaxID=171643 RepID=A0A9Q0X592_9SAUR|nr:hypothetical protein JRQ81_000018 [Phrynocephalus forsythii]